MTRTVLSLGSNLGDRMAHLQDAVRGLGSAALVVSHGYETPPWGDIEQPAYLNAVVLASDPGLGPLDWLERAQALERAAGRVRDPARRFGPRTLDVDVIAIWSGAEPVTWADSRLTLPHPRAHLRAFVLVPWLEVEPEAVLPGHGRVADLLRTEPLATDAAAVRRAGPIG